MLRAVPLLLCLATGCRCTEDPAGTAKGRRTQAAPSAEPEEAPPVATVNTAPGDHGPGEARFRVSGGWEAATTDASAVAWMGGAELRRIELVTSTDFRRRERQSFHVQLRFSPAYVPRPATFELGPQVEDPRGVVGASVVVHTDFVTVLAADPVGEVTLTAVTPTTISGTFRFQVWDKAHHDKEQRSQSVEVNGNFTAAVQATRAR